jgi:putative restriction endonuclease
MAELAEFDRPLFKKLAHNDTGAAAGHQGGFLVPKDLDPFFPQLEGRVTPESPTVDQHVRAALFIGSTPVGIVSTRYQYQTWGGTRGSERRMTANLGPLLNDAHADDFLVIERSVNDPFLYRLRLIRAGTRAYATLSERAGTRRWGPINVDDKPVPERAVEDALDEQIAHEEEPLDLFDNVAAFVESRTKRIARSRAFQQHVSTLYRFRCAVCGNALHSPIGDLSEIEAAHIVPRSLKGADDARNGLALCRSHHWAFDRGLFGINPAGTIEIPPKVMALAQNALLAPFAEQPLRPPTKKALRPAPNALAWHFDNIVGPHF